MKKIILPVFLGLIAASTASSNMTVIEDAVSTCTIQPIEMREANPITFAENEELTYNVYYGFAKIGSAIMTIRRTDDPSQYYILFTINSNSLARRLYKVDNSEETWVDTGSICSLKYVKHVRENKINEDKVITFDYTNRKFSFVQTDNNRSAITENKEGELFDCTNDPLSIFYYIRSLPLEVSKEFPMYMQSDYENYPLRIRVVKTERVSVPLGKFECFMVEPLSRNSDGTYSPSTKGSMQVWMTANDRKTPVLIKTSLSFGTLSLKLIKVK